jgi:hypothetical protein
MSALKFFSAQSCTKVRYQGVRLYKALGVMAQVSDCQFQGVTLRPSVQTIGSNHRFKPSVQTISPDRKFKS